MNELYEAIEKKIKSSGYPRLISGEDVYDDICDQIEGKENGEYILLSKFDDDVVFEYHITIQDDDFNLGILTMKTPEGVFEVDFYEGKDTIEHFEKLRNREIERLRVSLEMAKKAGYQKFTGMIFVENETKDILCFFML